MPVAVFAPAIFLGAFLLFLVQPLLGKYILPWFGGGPGVWTTCMLFFQVSLLAGYGCAHWLSTRVSPRRQVLVYLFLIVGAVATLPVNPGGSWKPVDGQSPTLRILLLLLTCVGLPYVVLAATGPLLQRWFSRACSSAPPYRLYALSNLGSLLALVSYPLWFEPRYTRTSQGGLWSGLFVCFSLLVLLPSLKLWKSAGDSNNADGGSPDEESVAIGFGQRLFWVLWPACASILLLAVTNKLCQDLAVIPFLWVLPLTVYLLSFILCFDNPRWYARVPFTLGLVGALAALTWSLFHSTDVPARTHIIVYTLALFVCCMVCHGEVYRLRPGASRLTAYYLAIAGGGALGGVFVAVLAPWIFNTFYELHAGLLLCGLLFLLGCVRDWRPTGAQPANSAPAWSGWKWLSYIFPIVAFAALDWLIARMDDRYSNLPSRWFVLMRVVMWVVLVFFAVSWFLRRMHKSFQHWRLLACLWLLASYGGLNAVLLNHALTRDPDMIHRDRNFYGSLTVYEHRRGEPNSDYRLLQHGGTTHGLQFVHPSRANWPTTYYGRESGVGKAFKALPPRDRRVGLVGLGIGTLASYGTAGDTFRIYEINPGVIRVATSQFRYLADCRAVCQVVQGDARLAMESEPPQNYDLLVLDAFSSDAIPVHLLTREAFAVYLRHLAPGGLLAIHISNHYLDLAPVVSRLARQFGFYMTLIDYEENAEEWWLYASSWMLLSQSEAATTAEGIRGRNPAPSPNPAPGPLWTDDFASVYQVLKK